MSLMWLNMGLLTTFSVSWIRRRAEGEGKFVSLERLRLLSLENKRMRKSPEVILKDDYSVDNHLP